MVSVTGCVKYNLPDSNAELQNAWKPDVASKSLYNYVVYDSVGVERSFAEALDKQDEVLVFAKLPSLFKIDTPLGSYNPDWAYVEEVEGEHRVYFVTCDQGRQERRARPARCGEDQGRLRQETLCCAGPRGRLPLQRAHNVPVRSGEGLRRRSRPER